MNQQTSNLGLPFIQPSQAMKHLTHNEALSLIDSLAHLVIVATVNEPPASPIESAPYLVGPNPTGVFAGKAGQIAIIDSMAGWRFVVPVAGWIGYFATDARFRFFDGGQWSLLSNLDGFAIDKLGINTPADAINRLSVASSASLFTHAGSDHRIVVNKADAGGTASLLYQDNFSGRAEIGLCGNDKLSMKMSADGNQFQTAIEIEHDGLVRMPQRPVARCTLGEQELLRPHLSPTGFNVLSVSQGGFALGNLVSSGVGKELVVPATGLYQVHLSVWHAPSNMPHTMWVMVNGVQTSCATRRWDTNPIINVSMSAPSVMPLSAGDKIWLQNNNNITYIFGLGRTELTVIMV